MLAAVAVESIKLKQNIVQAERISNLLDIF